MPAFESRRVRTQPFSVTAASFGAFPARICAQVSVVMDCSGEIGDRWRQLSHRRIAADFVAEQWRGALPLDANERLQPRDFAREPRAMRGLDDRSDVLVRAGRL